MKPEKSADKIQPDAKLGEPYRVQVFPGPEGDVVVRQYYVDPNQLEQCTAVRMDRLLRTKVPGCHYVTPRHTVSSATVNPEFIRRCCQVRVEWSISLRQILGTGGRRHVYHDVSEMERHFLFWGMLLIDGRIKASAKSWLAQHGPPERKTRERNCSKKVREINGLVTWIL